MRHSPFLGPLGVAAAPHEVNWTSKNSSRNGEVSELEVVSFPLQAFQFLTGNYIRRRI